MDTSKWSNSGDIRMQTAKGWDPDDVRMETAKAYPTSGSRGPALKLWERELLDSSEVKRKATVAQLCE
jgi:cell cycle protein kinase DBF2